MKIKGHVVTAFAEPASGPGWTNQPIWVIVRDADQNLQELCIQPEEQTPEMHALYQVSHAVHSSMTAAVVSQKHRSKK